MKAQGLDPDGNPLAAPVAADSNAQQVLGSDQAAAVSAEEQERLHRAQEAKAQAQKYSDLSREASSRGKDNFRRPKDKADRLRAGVPCVSNSCLRRLSSLRFDFLHRWKYKTRGSLFGDF